MTERPRSTTNDHEESWGKDEIKTSTLAKGAESRCEFPKRYVGGSFLESSSPNMSGEEQSKQIRCFNLSGPSEKCIGDFLGDLGALLGCLAYFPQLGFTLTCFEDPVGARPGPAGVAWGSSELLGDCSGLLGDCSGLLGRCPACASWRCPGFLGDRWLLRGAPWLLGVARLSGCQDFA